MGLTGARATWLSLGEGETPLVRAPRLAETLGQPALAGAFLLSVPAGLLAALGPDRQKPAARRVPSGPRAAAPTC